MDWEAFTGQGEMSWDEYEEKRPTSPVLMRVRLSPDDYFNYDYKDAAKLACYRVVSADQVFQVSSITAHDYRRS